MTGRLFDALRDAGFERLAAVRDRRGIRTLAARPDEEFAPVAEDDPALGEAARDLAAASAAAGDARRVECVYRKDAGLRLTVVRHEDDAARTVGPVRRLDLSVPEARVLRDACVAARHAAWSAAAGEVARGGAAAFLHAVPAGDHDRARSAQALAEELLLAGGAYWTDFGFADEWAKETGKRGGPVFGCRASSAATTALGGAAAVRAALGAIGPRADDAPPIVLVAGLGRTGAALARRLAEDGLRLVVADKDYPKIDAFLGALGPAERKNASVVAPYQVLEVAARPDACDVLCPAAEGGMLGEAALAKLRCRAVVGPADGTFDAASAEDERRLAKALYDRGILHLPSWIAGVGGAVHAAFEEADAGPKFDPRAAEARTERAAGWFLDDVVADAKRSGRTPTDVALRRLGFLHDA